MIEIDINRLFKHALFLMEDTRKNIFITGKAGTGKSTLLDYFCKISKKSPIVLAPTGVAALNVKGQTIHRFFNFHIDTTPQKILKQTTLPKNHKLYKKLNMIIIDEVSMLRADLLDCIDVFLRRFGPDNSKPFGGVQMVFVGDLYQLPPVIKNEEREVFNNTYKTPYFFSVKAVEKADLEILELETIYRQKDTKFISLLNKIRNNSVEDSDIEELNQRYIKDSLDNINDNFIINLTTTNKKANEINSLHLDNLKGHLYKGNAIIKGNFSKEYFPTSTELQFKIGAQIMLLNNDPKGRWVNGSIGEIISIKYDSEDNEYLRIKLKDCGRVVSLYSFTWEVYRFFTEAGSIKSEAVGSFIQYPFRLAWALTIHKSQGKTFDEVIIDIEKGTFASGQTYVALSRCTSFKGIRLKVPIKKHHIKTDPSIYKFLTSYAYKKAAEILPLKEKISIIEKAINENIQLKMTYLKANDIKSERIIIPIKVGEERYINKKFWGVLAYCTTKNEKRMFNVARILTLEEKITNSL